MVCFFASKGGLGALTQHAKEDQTEQDQPEMVDYHHIMPRFEGGVP